MLLNPAQRDPAARSRLIGALATLVILWPLFQAAEVKPGALFDPGNLKVIGNFLAGFLPPDAPVEARDFLRVLAIIIDTPIPLFPVNRGASKGTLDLAGDARPRR